MSVQWQNPDDIQWRIRPAPLNVKALVAMQTTLTADEPIPQWLRRAWENAFLEAEKDKA